MGKEDDVRAGRRIALALNETEKFLSKRENALIEEMVSRYRAGRTEHDWLIGRVAELSAGRYILAEMRRELTHGGRTEVDG